MPGRIAIFGAGAVGGQIAARLATSGTPVSLIARGAHLAAIRAEGLALVTGGETIRAAVTASDQASDLGIQDLVIVALKGTQLPQAVEGIRPLVASHTRVLFAMNGLPWWFTDGLPAPIGAALRLYLDPLGNIGAIVPSERSIWGVVTAGAAIVGPGTIRSTTPGANSIVLGYPDDRTDEPLRQAVEVLARAGYRASVAPAIRRAIWSKLLTNAAQAMVATATNRDHVEVTTDPETRAVIIAVMHEILAVGTAVGVDLAADPVELSAPGRFGHHVSSFLQDLRAGRPLELASTILAVRELARATAIAVPHLTTLAAIVAAQSADAARARLRFSDGSTTRSGQAHRGDRAETAVRERAAPSS